MAIFLSVPLVFLLIYTQLVLNSMHRYQPRIHIMKYISKKHQEKIFSYDFTETAFIAVTAYQNDQV